MKILYRYLYIRLFIYLLITLPSFSVVVLLAELVEILRKIKNFETLSLILYTFYKLPEKIYFILPVATVIAFILLIKELIERREIYPILLNGISLRQLGLNLFIFPLFLSVLQIVNLEFVMPSFKVKSENIYQKLKVGKIEGEKYLIAYEKWVSVGKNKFIYFGFLDLNRKIGRDIIYVEFDKNFKPIYRIEGKNFFINKDKIKVFDAKLIDFSKIEEKKINITKFHTYYITPDVNIKNLKNLFKFKKPVSMTDYYKSAKVFEKFGYSANYYWSRFFSALATVFSPLILTIAIYPFLWNKRKDRLVLAFVGIIFYWYGISFLTSLSESGAIPYITIFSIDILYLTIGIIKLRNLTFTEL